MRNISFQLTKDQILNRTKMVTRRLGWKNLKPGTRLQAVEKGMGLKKGETVKKLAVIDVVTVRREPLNVITDSDCADEGFPHFGPLDFVQMFCEHMGCTPETMITRIEFKYVE